MFLNEIALFSLKLGLFHTAHNSRHSKDLDALKFQLIRHDTFYNGQNQQDSTECLLILINVIHKGSLPDSISTSFPMGASLSDILFSFVLEKYIVCDVCGLRSPSFESSSVLYISPTNTSSMQNLILQGLQQKLQKSCSRCNKNTWNVESNYILQPPKYLLLFVNRFRYINNNVTKDRCSIPMDTTIRLGPLRFSLRATIDHHGPSIHSGHYTSSINCCKKTFYCNDHTITEFGIIDSKDSSTAYVILYELIDIWFLDSNWRVGVCSLPCNGAGTSSPSHWQQVEEQVPKPVGWMMCFLLMTFVPVQKPCVYKHIYMPFYMSSVFFGLPIVSCPLMINNSLIPGCLWLLAFVLNNTLLLGIWCSTIPHLPGCFCPWTFFQNFGFNMVPSDPCMSHLATQLGYSAGEFQALELIVLATFDVVD